MEVLLNDDALFLKLRSYSSNLTIELQDPDAFYTLSSDQQFRLYERIQQLEASGLPIWLDDIDEKVFTTFSNENWRLSGVKFDKKHSGTLYQIRKNCARLFLLDIRSQPMC